MNYFDYTGFDKKSWLGVILLATVLFGLTWHFQRKESGWMELQRRDKQDYQYPALRLGEVVVDVYMRVLWEQLLEVGGASSIVVTGAIGTVETIQAVGREVVRRIYNEKGVQIEGPK